MNIAGPHLDAELFAGHGRKKLSMNLTTHAFQPEVQTTKQKSRSRDSNPQAQNTEAVMLTIRLPCCCRFDYVTETNNCFILTTGAIPIKPATSRSKSRDHKSTNYTFMDCRPNISFGGGRLYNLVKGGFWCGVCMFKPHACSLGSVVCWGFPMGIPDGNCFHFAVDSSDNIMQTNLWVELADITCKRKFRIAFLPMKCACCTSPRL